MPCNLLSSCTNLPLSNFFLFFRISWQWFILFFLWKPFRLWWLQRFSLIRARNHSIDLFIYLYRCLIITHLIRRVFKGYIAILIRIRLLMFHIDWQFIALLLEIVFTCSHWWFYFFCINYKVVYSCRHFLRSYSSLHLQIDMNIWSARLGIWLVSLVKWYVSFHIFAIIFLDNAFFGQKFVYDIFWFERFLSDLLPAIFAIIRNFFLFLYTHRSFWLISIS
jgi:hypothetical protein